jgi:penicillin-binding protein 1A
MSRSQRYRRRRRGRGRHRSQALLAVMVVLVGVGIAGLSVVGWVVSTAASAPALTTLKERDPGSNTEVLAADGTRLGFISADELSRPVEGSRLPKLLKDATVAIEDERFYKHEGVDYEGIIRAAVKNFMSQ